MKYVLLMSLLIVGCEQIELPIGAKVTNCACDGYIADASTYSYKISPADCGEVIYNYIIEKKNKVTRIENKKRFCGDK